MLIYSRYHCSKQARIAARQRNALKNGLGKEIQNKYDYVKLLMEAFFQKEKNKMIRLW